VTSCPEKDVLAVIDGKARLVNPTACIGHGACLRACPVDAITLVLGTEKRGVDIPLLATDFQTNVPGLYIVGELGGMGLIYNAMTQGLQCMEALLKAPPAKADGVHQLVIVGAGPAGLAAALAALEAKLDFVIVDQESVGGTVLHYPRHKIVMTRPVELPLYGKLKVSEVKKEALLAVWEDILKKTGLNVKTGVRVDDVKRHADGVFEVMTSAGALKAQRVVLAMGRRGSPRKLGVPGEELSKVVYRLLEPESYAGAHCLVVGGGDAAVEAAIALGEAGATVHLAHRGDVFDRIKPKNQQKLDASTGAGKVKLLLKAQTKQISESAVALEVGGQAQEVKNDYVLIFAGGVLPTAFLEKAGVQVKTMKGEAYAPANR
jgi:thioredoxin reductase